MASADGSVIIQVNMNVDDAERELQKLRGKIEVLEKQLGKADLYDELSSSIATVNQELEAAKKKLTDISAGTSMQEMSGDTKQAEQHVASLERELSDLLSMQKELEQSGFGSDFRDSKNYRALLQTRNELAAEAGSLIAQINNAWLHGRVTSLKETTKYDSTKILEDIDGFSKEIGKSEKSLKEANASLDASKTSYGEIFEKAQQIHTEEQRRAETTQSAAVSDQRMVDLNQELLRLKEQQTALEKAGLGFGYQDYDVTIARIAEITRELKEYKKALTSGGMGKSSQESALQGGGKLTYADRDYDAEALARRERAIELHRSILIRLQSIYQEAYSELAPTIEQIRTKLSEWFEPAVQKAAPYLDSAKSYLSEKIQEIGERLGIDLDETLQYGKHNLEIGFKGMLSITASALDNIVLLFMEAKDSLAIGVRGIVDFVKELPEKFKDGFSNIRSFLSGRGKPDGSEGAEEPIRRSALAAERLKAILARTVDTFKLFGTAASAVKEIGSALLSGAKNVVSMASGMNALSKLTDAVGKKFKYFSRMLKRTFMTFTILKGLRAIRQQITTYLSVNAELSTALRSLKGVFLTAFQPVYEIAVPALITLINAITRAVAAISQFTAVLFGTTAKKAQENAKALYAQANATKAAGGAAEEASKSFANFDEINQLQDNKSGGGGGGTAEALGPDFDYEYEDTVFDSWGEAFSAFLDKLLAGIPKLEKAFKNFADWLNGLSKKFYDMFTFPGVLEKVQQLGRDLANAFNKLVDWINFKQLGQALGAGLNLALQFLVNFLYAFDWKNLGKKLADFVNGLVLEVNWYDFGRFLWAGFKISFETLAGFLLGLNMPELADAATKLITGFFDSMKETIENMEWREIGEQIRTFLVNVDWGSIADSVFGAVKAAFTASSDFFSGLLGEEVKRIVTDLLIFLGESLLVIGALLTFTGANPALGLGLMAKGALSLGAAAVLDWEYVSGNIRRIAAELLSLLSGASLVLGAILALSGANIPLGIGLIAIGAVSLAASAAVNWDTISTALQSPINKITAFVGGALLAVGAMVALSGANVPLGIGLLAAGALTLAAAVNLNWDSMVTTLSTTLGLITTIASAFLLALGIILCASGVNLPLGIALVSAGAVGLVTVSKINWNAIKEKLVGVWQGIQSWWKGDVEEYTKKKHWEGVGKNVADGLIDGLDTVHSKLKRWSSDVTSTINNTLSTVNTKVQRTISSASMNYYPRTAQASYPDISTYNLPRLATGAVIPPNREFMAILGDQRSGTNIETPLSTMVQAFRQAMSEGGYANGNRDITVVLQLDKREFGRAVYTANNEETQRVGVRLVRGSTT